MGAGLILQQISRPRILHDRVAPKQPTKKVAHRNSALILDRVKVRAWLIEVQDALFLHIQQMHWETKMIEHLPKNKMGMIELTLDAERYMGSKCGIWWLDQQASEWIEKSWRSCPKMKDYHIGNYWEQAEWYKEHGNCNVPGQNTEQFILDRAKWAYEKIGKNIKICRKMMRLVKNWNFSEEQQREYRVLEDRLYSFGLRLP
jgi:hypothetical protein